MKKANFTSFGIWNIHFGAEIHAKRKLLQFLFYISVVKNTPVCALSHFRTAAYQMDLVCSNSHVTTRDPILDDAPIDDAWAEAMQVPPVRRLSDPILMDTSGLAPSWESSPSQLRQVSKDGSASPSATGTDASVISGAVFF